MGADTKLVRVPLRLFREMRVVAAARGLTIAGVVELAWQALKEKDPSVNRIIGALNEEITETEKH